jgi:hypothetical protein
VNKKKNLYEFFKKKKNIFSLNRIFFIHKKKKLIIQYKIH